MFKNYLFTAWRNITKDKFYALLNVIGLTMGLTAALFIFLYVKNEITFDKSNLNYKRIYRLESRFVINEKDDLMAKTAIQLAPTLKDEYPEIEEFARFAQRGSYYLSFGEKEFQEDHIFFADSTVFRVFTYPFVRGDPNTALIRPYSMVLTESMAKRYFGKQDPLGHVLRSAEGNLYEVTGIIEDLPGNMHLRFDALLSIATARQEFGADRFNDRGAQSFWSYNVYSYILLKEGTHIESVLFKFPAFYSKYMKSFGDKIFGNYILMAKPLARVHHYSSDLAYDQPGGNMKYVSVFLLVAIFILIIASINYMNLATARSSSRSREIGIRKIAGALPQMLRRQFIAESILIVSISTFISLILTWLLMPFFNNLTQMNLRFSVLFEPVVIGGILVMAFIVALLSGSYPAWYLSSLDPIRVIRAQSDTKRGSGLLRKILVVFQFAISVMMITGTLIIRSQLSFMQNSDAGFDKENLLVMEMRDSTLKISIEPFRQELLKYPDIKMVSFSDGNPGYDPYIRAIRFEGDQGKMLDRTINVMYADYDYARMMGIQIVEGRYYDREMKSDAEKAFVINETAALKFGWIDSASRANGNYTSVIGKRFHWGLHTDGTADRDGQIVGVMKDFHYASMRNTIEPLVIILNTEDQNLFFANIRIISRNRVKTIEYINKVRQLFKDPYPFKYNFLDDHLRDYYQVEKRTEMLSRTFALLTILIASLGLLGLSSFLIRIRTREIGIRKISGARANRIVFLFVKEFSAWVILANMLAAPVVIILLTKWLRSFPYQTGIHPWIFIAGLILSLVVALLTVSVRVFQAASLDPSEAVRHSCS
jgi:putative ABC transport system permease protein